jgi:hypothetical protein
MSNFIVGVISVTPDANAPLRIEADGSSATKPIGSPLVVVLTDDAEFATARDPLGITVTGDSGITADPVSKFMLFQFLGDVS